METKHHLRRPAQGATLIEVAVVLVCISLLFVSIVKGSELIHNTQSKRLARDVGEQRLAHLAYMHRYDAMPGDDPRASRRWPGAKDGNGDQQISGIYSDAPPASASALHVSGVAGENLNYWWHLRAAGLLQDGALNLASTANSGVGAVTVQQGAYGVRGPAVCYHQISGRLAGAIDRERDDGFANAGSLRASTEPNMTPTSHYGDTGHYILCASLGGNGSGLASALLSPLAAPPVTAGNPNAAGGNPNAHGGNPNAAGGNPNAQGGNPNASGGQS
jgi:hypothetical protein